MRNPIIVGALGLFIVLVAFAVHQERGVLPSIEQVQKDMGVWALQKERAVIRGRPLWQHRFTRDASKVEYRGEDFSLYTDDNGRVIAFWAYAEDPPRYTDVGGSLREFVRRTDDALKTYYINVYGEYLPWSGEVMEFFRRYIGDFRVQAPPYKEAHWSARPEREEFMRRETRSHFWQFHRFEIEITTTTNFEDGAFEKPASRSMFIIVKSRHW